MGDCKQEFWYFFNGNRTKEFWENECEHNCWEIEKDIWLRFTDKDCINCGRNRVEISISGKRVCEKCHMNQDTKKYELDGKYLYHVECKNNINKQLAKYSTE